MELASVIAHLRFDYSRIYCRLDLLICLALIVMSVCLPLCVCLSVFLHLSVFPRLSFFLCLFQFSICDICYVTSASDLPSGFAILCLFIP